MPVTAGRDREDAALRRNLQPQMSRLLAAVGGRHLQSVGHEVVICNSRQPETLAETVAALGKGARAATLEETARLEIVFLCVWWDTVPSVMQRVATWDGRILVDTTNQLTRTPEGYRPAKTDPLTGSGKSSLALVYCGGMPA